MADKKISQLTGATTPLGGTEEVPLVQSSTTKKVTVANLTAGRAVAVSSLSTTSDIAVGTVGSKLTFDTTGSAGSTYLQTTNGYDLTIYNARGGNPNIVLHNTDGVQLKSGSTVDWKTGSGNLIQGTAAKGINFTANTPASGMTSQLLNAYEEGTFLPTVSGSTTAGVGTYTGRAGHYTRVGNVVTCQMYIGWNAHTGTGDLLLTDLPFSFASGTYAAATVGYCNNLALSANNVLTVFANAAGTSMIFGQYPVGGGAFSTVPMDTSADLVLSVTYRV